MRPIFSFLISLESDICLFINWRLPKIGDVAGKLFGRWLQLWECSYNKAEARRWAVLGVRATRPRAGETFREDAAISELFHRDFPVGGNPKVTQWQTDTGLVWELEFLDVPALTAIYASQAETFLFLGQLVTLSQMFPFCYLSEDLKLLDRDRDTHMTINLQGLPYPHGGRNL